jgi:hypothetical protein
MYAAEIISEIENLPHNQKFYVVEETLKSIKKDELNNRIETAADRLYDDYKQDKDLTAFTALDLESFYETR